ncbi:hypothetical protein Goshw_015065 [Gossypium schwendimanii]|uniref:DUF4283 domain-containing protein n=1 Tax=Gossypium schwendimanii TaxID=34291 RepID=A0A7J9NEW5_GOSSC|nr:hypothetical protein [Gossypium schwendimanii]
MRSTLANVCHLIGGVFIVDLEDGRFLFQFYMEVDAKRIVRDGPWTFNSHLLILHRLREGENLMIIELFFVDFWYDMIAIQSGSKQIMHIRVKIDVQQLLRRKNFLCQMAIVLMRTSTTIPKQDVVFQWDLSLRAPPRKVAVWKSKWMMEDGNGDGTKLGNFLNMAGGIRGDS